MARSSVYVYANGLCHCSVCVPGRLTPDEVEAAVNAINPTGIHRRRWKIDEAPTFKGGEANPCTCQDDPSRKHYLMVC